MALTKSQEQAADSFIDLARSKGYRDETIEILLMLACTKDMHMAYGNSEKAIRKITSFCRESNDSDECMTKTLTLMGHPEL